MNSYAIIARLLDYPDDALIAHLDEACQRLVRAVDLDAAARQTLIAAVDWMRGLDPLELQAEYVQTFDTTPENALYLTHHTYGDSRERGPALVELGEYYKAAGFGLRDGELPDYLPAMLEFAAWLDEERAAAFLAEAAPIVDRLAAGLEQAGNGFAPLLRFVADRGRQARAAA